MSKISTPAKHFLSTYLKESDEEILTTRYEELLKEAGGDDSNNAIEISSWLEPRVQKHKAYRNLRDSFQNDYPPKVAELGCGIGTNTRQLMLDGLPSENVLAVDVERKYWDLGLKFYRDAEKIKTKTVFCDFAASSEGESPLHQFKERYDAAYALERLQLLGKEEGKLFLASAFDLLAPGGVFFGTTTGSKEDSEGEKGWLADRNALFDALKDAGFSDVSVGKVTSSPEGTDVDEEMHWSFVAKKTLPEWSSC